VKAIRITNDGDDFLTPGRRSFDDYQEGHSAEEPGRYNGPAAGRGAELRRAGSAPRSSSEPSSTPPRPIRTEPWRETSCAAFRTTRSE
jgi:hypothetical protein